MEAELKSVGAMKDAIVNMKLDKGIAEVIANTVEISANLKPVKICGVEEQGMLLAAKAGKELKLITVDGEVPSGASVG